MSLRRSRLVSVASLLLAGIAAVPALALPTQVEGPVRPIVDAVNPGCDPIDPALCLLPFPNDFFTRADATSATGRRVNFNAAAMPRNAAGKPVDPTEWNRNDGFSPGSMILTYAPGIDLRRTWGKDKDQIEDIGLSLAKKAPLVIIDTVTGKRHPFWSELDTHPDTTDDRRALILRPAKNFTEGRRYVVAMRNLKNGAGNVLAPNAWFKAYRDKTALPQPNPVAEARRPAMERVFADLDRAKVRRDDLYLAWDFTVASEQSLAGRALSIRDQAFAQLGDTNLADLVPSGNAPKVSVESVTDFPKGATQRRIEGTVTVPNFLTYEVKQEPTGSGYEAVAAPGARFFRANPLDENPSQNPAMPTIDVPFLCNLPRAASATTPANPMLYGHGLLGARQESNGGSTEDMRLRNFAPCAVDWMGMSFSDLANVATILADMSNFASLADRGQQGFLNWMFLGRALVHPEGLAANPAFQDANGAPLINDDLVYDGNSQGGIMGGALTALAPDFTTAVLGVPGMNYSTMLNRSKDWEGEYDPATRTQEGLEEQDPEGLLPPYSYPAYVSYPDKLEQQVVFGLIQMLWDRAEANGYAAHMTDDPYENTPKHSVMLQVAFADHQVANIAAEVEARTIGAQLHNAKMPVPNDLHWSDEPEFGFETSQFGVPGKSHLVYWYSDDRGLTTPPNGNIPPSIGTDPHEAPRKNNRGSDQKAVFLRTSTLIDVCGGPCVTNAAAERN